MTKRKQTEFAKLVASARKSVGLSLRALAECVGVSHTAIAQIERGEYVPSDATISRLAACLPELEMTFFDAARRLTPQASAVVQLLPAQSSRLLEAFGKLTPLAREFLIDTVCGLENA